MELNRNLIDFIKPKHDRTSCNDQNLENANPNSNGTIRCGRCALLNLENEHFDSLDQIEQELNDVHSCSDELMGNRIR